MSFPNYLDRLREKIAVWIKRHYRLRQRQLKVVRLEDRRLPDASFALVGDLLTVEGFDGATDAVDVSFDANNNEFQLELSSGTWLSENPGPLDPTVSLNGNVLTVALPSLSELQIHGSGTPIHITDSGNSFSIGRLAITGAADVVLDSGNDIDSISIEADSLTLNDSDDLEISTLTVTNSVDLSVAGTVTNSLDAQIEVGGHASFEASSVVLGQHAADHVDLSSLSVTATGSVQIDVDSAVELTGSSSAAELTLSSKDSIQLADTATLIVHGNTDLTAHEIDVRGEFHSSSLTFHSAGHVHIHESSEMTLIGQSSASSLALEVDGLLADTADSLLQVTGHAELNADSITLGNGDVEIGSLQFESVGTVTLLQESKVQLSGDSYAGSLVAEHAQLIGTGIIHNGIEISDGGLLGGWLNISGALTIGPNGVLSPGNSPGITTSGNLTLAANSTLLIELDDDNAGGYPGAVAGVDYDQTQVTGTVTINATATLNLQDLGSTQSLTGDVYVIVQNDGVDAVVGTFSGLANGAVVTAGSGGAYSIYYNGGTGNDVVLIRRPASLSEVYVSTTFVGLSNGASVADYDFLTAGNQAGVYGLNAFATIPEAITAVTTGGVIHVDQGTYLHSSTLAINKTVTIDGQGMGLTNILKSGAPTGNFDEAIRITADQVILSDAKLGWQIHNTTDYQGYVVVTTADFTSINRILFGSNATGEGYRSAVVFEGSGANGADGLEVSDSVFEGRWGRAAIRDGDAGSGQNILITRNEFREDHFRWGPISIGPQDSAGTPNNFAFSGEISFNYFGNGLDTLDFQSLGNQNYTVTIMNQGLTATGLDIVHNTFDWNDSTETNANGVYAQPAGVYITPSLTQNTNQILIQDNIFNNFAYAGPQPGSTDPLWRPTGGVFGGALEFDGADDFGVWQSSLFDVGTAGTLNFWVQMHDTTRRNQFFEGPGNAGFEMQYRTTSGGQVYGRTTTVGGDNVIRSGPDGATLLNSWHNIQYTWDFNATNATGRMRIYVDGVESGYLTNFTPNDLTWASAVSTVNGLMNIGRDPGDTTRYFDGLMDDVGWFNSVLNSTDRTNILTNGVSSLASDARLVSHWDFNQSSGDIAVDNKNGIQLYLSTTGVVPTEFGAVFRPGQGQFGGALEFDGLDDFATFRSSDFNIGERGTLNFWVRMHDTSRRNQFFEGPDNAGLEFQFRNNSNGQVYGRTTTAGGDFVIRSGPDGATLLNSWHNIQYTWNFNATNAVGKMRIYVDGVESGYLTGSTPNDLTWTAITDTVNGLMNVGRDPGDLTRFFDGLLDDIAWYDQVLSVSDRSTIQTTGVSAHADLVAHWNLDDAIGTTEATGNSGTNNTLYVNQIAPLPPVSGYGVVTPLAALVQNNVFYNDVAGTYADSNQVLAPSNINGAGANPFFAGDDPHTVFTGTTLAEFYRLRFGSSAAYQSTEFQADIATLIPHVGANQENPVAVGTEDILIAGTDFDDLVVITFTSDNDGSFVFTRNVTSGTPDYVGTFNFIDITSFTFDGYGADDVLIIIQPTATQGGLYSLSKGIAFHGDLQNSNGNALNSDGVIGGDTLVLLTSANDQAIIDSVSYVLGNDDPTIRHQGTISVADGLLSTTITYTGTEPIRDELIADARTFSFGSTVGGGTETINVSAVGDTVAMAAVVPSRPAVSSRTLNNRIVSSLSPNISFASPRTHLTLNTGLGNDTININSLHTDYRSALTINGDGGTDAVNLNSSLTLGNAVAGNTGNLTVTSETVVVANGVAINTTAESSDDGDIRFTSTGSVNIGTGASLTTISGFVIVTTVHGDIAVDGTISTGSDNILLMAHGAGRDIEITADVSSTSGHVTLIADDSVRLMPNVDVQVGNAGTLIIEATNGVITMDATAALTSANGGIRLLALNNITVGDITSSNSHVSITSSLGSILDAETNDSESDVVALGLRLQAALGIGTLGGSSNPIETTISTLSARAGSGGINIFESNGLTVDDVTITTQKVQTNNSLMATTDAVQSDLVTINAGSIVLRSTNGTMTLNDGTGSANGIAVSANGAGNVLLQTTSGAADVVVNGNVEAGVGHVSLFSSDDIDLNANVSTGGSGTVYLAAGNIENDALTGIKMQNGTSITTAGGNVRLTADRESDVLLGLINVEQGNVSVLAERNVLDSNGAALNVQANAVRIVADAALSNVANQTGIIGGSETGNPDPNSNTNAIDLQVTTLAAQSATGIYLREADGLNVDATPQIVVQSVNADASSTTQSDGSLSDLVTTNNGPIKLQAATGSLTLNDGDGDTLAVSANGTGDVLLQTQGSNGDVLISAAIGSITGNITINSADDIVVNGAITTGGGGTIYLAANNGAVDAIGSQVDGITLNFGVTSSSGDVLISSQNDVQQSALISSVSGDIGIIATQDVEQSAAGDVTTTNGNVLVQASSGNWTMNADATITAGGGDILGTAGTDITLGVIKSTNATANRIALHAVAGSITDANVAVINIEETVAGATTSLSLRAGTIIGGAGGTTSSANNQALDIDVDTVAANAATGIYLREVADGGSITVDSASAVTVNINGVVRADFRSSTTSVAENRIIASLEDLTTSRNGPIKLVAENGTITINGGNDASGVSANGTGDVLLEARGTSSDLVINSTVSSDSGHITLDADGNTDINAAVTVSSGNGTVYVLSGTDTDVDAQVSSANGDILLEAGDDLRQTALIRSTAGDIGIIAANSITQAVNGDVTTTTGDILIEAGADWTMNGGATITAGGSDVLGKAGNSITLGVISVTNANSNRVALQAVAGNITDANAATINVEETVAGATTSLSLRAGTIIGGAGGTTSSSNNQAIDIDVDNVAASAATGIYLREVATGGAITVDTASAVTVNINGVVRADFDSSTTSVAETRSIASLEDLTTSSNGPIKLVAENGTIEIRGGANSTGVNANGTGDVLLEARGANSDVIVNATITSGSGHVTLDAADDVDLNAALSTGGTGTVFITGAGVSIDATVTSVNGDVLILSTQEITQTAAINSTNGDVGLIADLAITQTVNGDITTTTGDVLIEAGTDWEMSGGTVVNAGGGDFDGKALTGDLALGQINSARTALTAGSDISDANGTTLNVIGTSVSLRAGGLIGNHQNGNGTSLINANAIDTEVSTLAASAGTGIYIEEANSLTIDTVANVSVSVNNPKQANFDSATTDVPESRSTAVLEDLTTTNNGPIKIVTVNGSLTVNGGSLAASGLTAHGTGDVLLEARGAGSDVTLNADISSNTGDVTVIAADSVLINRDVTTNGTGTVFVQAQSGTITLTDGDSNSTGVQTGAGDILLQASSNITLNAELESTAANIGVDAGANLEQSKDITAGADVLLVAVKNITMHGSAVTEAVGGELIMNAGENISLGLLQATNVSLESGGSILDVRVAETTNIRAANLRMVAGGEIGASDSGSSADTNLHAIDTEVTNLAAQSAAGIHVQEAAAGGAVIVRDVASIKTTISVERANFNSTQSVVTQSNVMSGLADLTTTLNGDIKLVAKNGSITINDGVAGVINAANSRGLQAHGSGDVLLEARGALSDVLINSSIRSGSGHITLNGADAVDLYASIQTGGNGTVFIVAGTDIDLDADLITISGDILVQAGRDLTQTDLIQSTAGDIGLMAARNLLQSATGDMSTSLGNVLVEAGTNWEMNGDTTITVGGGKVVGQAQSGRILLGVIELTNATNNQVALAAGSDLADANGAAINIYESTASSETSVSLRSGGAIGSSDLPNPLPGQNVNALDLNVDVVSASAMAGIYLREVAAGGGLTVSTVDAVSVSINGVQRSRFNSSSTNAGLSRTVAALEDLGTSSGPVKLVTENGTIVLNGGVDSTGLSAGGSGDVLLEARGVGSDVVVDGTISNGTGHVTLNATDHVDLNAALSTGGSGTVFMTGASISIDANVTTWNGDVLISSTQGIIQTATINSSQGDVGLIAGLTISQSNSGDITTTSGDVFVEAGTDWTMFNGTVITAGGGDFDGKALAGDIALGRINSERTALTAGSDISDANSTTLNVVGTSLSLRAGGLIGNHDNANQTPLSNTNAIDTQITTLAALAGTGIYLEEANSLTIDSVTSINVSVDGPVRTNFKSNTTDVSLSRSTAVLEDLTTTNNGPIKIVTLDGDITVNGGTTVALGISANGTGDVLLEARSAGSDLRVNSDVISGTGHISLVAADSISIVRDIITGGAGSVLINADKGSITLTDADANITGIRTSSGDILLQAAQNVTLTADVESASGNIGVESGSDLQQNRNITAGGDILLASAQSITMAATAETKANGGEMILTAGRDISLGLLQTTNVSLNSGADIRDAHLAEATNIRATNLRMIAAGAIGDSDLGSDSGINRHAIDTEVTNLAGKSGTGIHVREMSAGDSVVVRDIAAISVNITSGRVNFNSTRTDVVLTQRLSGLSDLTTTRNGDIKLLAENGPITIQDGSNGVPQASDGKGVSAHGTGDVLLESRGNGSDIVVNSDVESGSGHITVNAADDVNLTAEIGTSGTGTVYVRSMNNFNDGLTGIVMANDTSIMTGGGNVRLIAANESDIRLGLINAGTGDVSLSAEGSVLDNNGSSLNVQSDALRIVADAAISGAGSVISLNGNGAGIIGGAETGNGAPDANINALDLQVSTVAAQSADGIYLRETDGLTIQSTGIISVEQSNFNSSTTTRTDASLSDLVTTDNGSIKLLSAQGTITVSDGDGDGVGIKADGTGEVLLQTQSATGDVIVDAAITSALGHVNLRAADDVDVNASISTGGTGTVFITGAGVSIDSTTTTADGDVLISSTQSLRQTALISSASGNVGLIATTTIVQSDSGDITSLSGDVLIEAGKDWTMSTDTVISAGGGDFDGKSLAGDIALGQIRSARAAVTAGNDVSDANGTALNMIGTSVTFRAGGQIGNSDPTNGTLLTNLNAIDTQVSTLAALAGTGIFIEDADSLIIDSVAAVNVSIAGPKQANFNSSTTNVPQSRGTAILEDLTMTGVGEIRITTVSDSITLNRGTAIAGDVLKDIAVYAPGGGKVSIQAATNIYVRGNIVTRPEGIVSTDPTTDGIRLIASSGDIVIGDPSDLTRQIVISTDHDEVNGSDDTTDDVVDLMARVGQVGNTTVGGKISIQSPVTIRTEGGVAKKFGPRPDVGVPSTAFFQYVSNPLPLAIDNSPAAWSTGNAYINAFHVLIGQSGEENLTVDIDWQDPSEEPGVYNDSGTQTIARNLGIYNQISSERIQQFLVEKGGPSTQAIDNNTNGQIVVGHLYTALDYTRFQQQQNRTTIIIDLSVSQHSSINLTASSIAQSGVTQIVPGLDAASTDISTTVSDRGSDTPDIFENGIASFKIPTVTPAPPALFTSTFVPRADRPLNVAPPENQAAMSAQSTAEFGSGAVGGSVFSTEVYFQIRRQYETDGPAEVVVERIVDSSLISSREAFEKFVEQNPELQDGAGYEIWLISETGGQKVERPIVEFEISGGQPGTMNDAEPEGSPAQQLKDLPFEQPAAADANPEAQDSEIPQASMDVDSATPESAHKATSPEINTADRAVSTASGSEQETSTLVSEPLNPSSAALLGLMIRRFRKRQQESATAQSTFSRAARFQRKHSSPNAESEVRGSSDV